ncbi:MAG TPA: glycogen debranching protein [Bryobacteraceae bacterium]|jgi:glycogen debranching enzyme|nr:glycogen debranching protein [Bryobacteraceae bacterium]
MAKTGYLLALLSISALAADLTPVANFSTPVGGPQILSPAIPDHPWTVAGEHGALLGRQDGTFEAWLWPVKILSHFRISAELADYAVPIDVNGLAAEIKVTGPETVITYSHAAFTIRQHMFAPRAEATPATGAVVFFEIHSVRPLRLTLSFTPEMLRMWPAPNFGRPNGEWVQQGSIGAYVLHTDNPAFSAIVAMPRTRPGIMVPYQEHPQTYPLQFQLSFNPVRDAGLVFPLILTMNNGTSVFDQATKVNSAIPDLYKQTKDYYSHFFETRLTIDTPDNHLNEALQWAELAIDEMQVRYGDETGLVAGYYESAASARPGFGWFFGRDTLWTTYAINSYGDFALTRRGLDFLIQRQREDGKIMHEFSQAAGLVNWKATPYFYASADATPLLVMAMWDYVRTSGDISYLQSNWNAVKKAYGFTRTHEGSDGIYTNAEGTGWVESWPPGMPHQEIYLASLDQQSCQAMGHLAALAGDAVLASEARKRAEAIANTIQSSFYEPGAKFYAFSHNTNGSLDQTATIYPAVAWWDGDWALKNAGEMLTRWASKEFSTDWGTRDLSDNALFYDPISYHQGSVWPLFTGWVSLAEYRAGRPLSGYAHLMQNANLTWAQDLGSVTELLSGEFFQPLGRSSSHQMWSSAMIITPLLRGLFGLDWDAPNHTLRVSPHLPANWNRATLRNVHLGSSTFTVEYVRNGGQLTVGARTQTPEVLCVVASSGPERPCQAEKSTMHVVTAPVPAVELAMPSELPTPGSWTTRLKALDEKVTDRGESFTFEALGGSSYDLPVRINRAHMSVEGAEMRNGSVHVEFPAGSGYEKKTVRFEW